MIINHLKIEISQKTKHINIDNAFTIKFLKILTVIPI